MGRVEMRVVAVQRDQYGPESAFALILEEKYGYRRLKIIIAHAEAQAISMELEKYTFRRPLTHDLLVSIIHALDARVLELNIHKLEDNTFFAYLLIESSSNVVVEVDCRPSDGVAIALKTKAPIYCEEQLLEIAGLPIEEEEEPELAESTPSRRLSKSPEPPYLPPPPLQLLIEMITLGSGYSAESLQESLAHLSPEDKKELQELLEKLLSESIQKEDYELAARIRDVIQRLNNL